MQEVTNCAARSQQVFGLPSKTSLTTLPETTSVEHKPSSDPVLQGTSDRLTAEQERVMIEHLPIVRFIARRIHQRLPQHVPIEDLYSAGILGLLDAFGKFDPSKQVLFRSYAQFRIRGAILDSLRTLDWGPRELRRKGRAIEEATQTLIAQFHRSPTEIEIAQKLTIPLAVYQQILGELNSLEIGSLQSERSEDSSEDELDSIAGRTKDDPLLRYLEAEMQQLLTKSINELPERERMIMSLYYYEELTMKEIGLILGVVESRVSQIHASAVLHLRARLAAPRTIEKPGEENPSAKRRDCHHRRA